MPKSLEYPLDHKIAIAVEPMRQAARDDAREATVHFHAMLKQKLAEQPDMEILAPYPKANIGRVEYKKQLSWRNNVQRLTNPVRADGSRYSTRMHGDPDLRQWDDDAAARDIESAMEVAESSFVAYVYKLIQKVEHSPNAYEPGIAIESAEVLEFGSLWSFSNLRVTFADGAVQVWHTKRIVNCSPLGTLFNQWPTRLLK